MATPEQWAQAEEWADNPMIGASDACLLELRARVEALTLALKDEADCNTACVRNIVERLKKLEANSKSTPNPSQIRSSLVERVALAISGIEYGLERDEEAVNWASEARAAIREVAAWMRGDGDLIAATVLEREAER
jgi:hypothetical protein